MVVNLREFGKSLLQKKREKEELKRQRSLFASKHQKTLKSESQLDPDMEEQIKAPPRKIVNEYEGVEINRDEELANDPLAREINQLITAKDEIQIELLK